MIGALTFSAGTIAAGATGAATTPSFIGAGAGVSETSQAVNLAVPYPASIQAGDLLLMQVSVRDSSGQAVTTPSGWTQHFSGVGDNEANIAQWILGKIATGSESGTLSVDWTGDAAGVTAGARMYLFRNVASSNYIEGAAVFIASGGVGQLTMPTVATTGNNRLAVAFLCLGLNRSPTAATGETGGDWVIATAVYAVAGGSGSAIQLQIADMSSGGTISGGTTTFATNPRALVRAFALVPA